MNLRVLLAGVVACVSTAVFGQTQVIVNGGFEQGGGGWSFAGAPPAIVGSDTTSTHFARSGTHFLQLGNASSAIQQVTQEINIPTNATVATLNYYWAVLSQNTKGIDHLRVRIINATNFTTLATVDEQFNTSAQNFYFQKSFNLTPYLGTPISLFFGLTTDPVNGSLTRMFIDDVSVFTGTNGDIPVNDAFADRALLTGTTATVTSTNLFASKEPGEPNHAGNGGGRSLWWRWVAPTGGSVQLGTSGSTVSPLLAVYTGTMVTNLAEIDSDNGAEHSSGLANIKFNVAGGVEYQIALDTFHGNVGRVVLNLKFTPDTKAPTVSITSPASNASTTNNTLAVQGKASDTLGVSRVEYRLENASGTNDYQLASGTNTWSGAVSNFVPGLNIIRARAFDTSSNVSATVTRSFTYLVESPLVLTISGNGTVSPNLNGSLLAEGTAYTITAKPDAGNLFAGWSGGASSLDPKLTFVMSSNLTLQANFIANPFIPVTGTYQGLFFDTNGIALPSSGFFSLTLKNTGSFSAKILQGGKSVSASGVFTLDGSFSNAIPRKGFSPLIVQLQLDLSGDTLSGQLSDGTWTAQLQANRAVFSKTNLAPQAGKYTLLIPGGADSINQPGGESYGTATVDPAGGLSFSGVLADGSKAAQKTFVSSQGQWPFYLSLNKGAALAIGWLTLTNGGTNDVDGLVDWIRLPAATAKFYPAGFTNESRVAGSVFSNTVPILNVSTGLVSLANGNLSASFTNEVVLGTTGKAIGTTNSANLSVTTSSGLFKGSAPNPDTGKAVPFNGVVLQKQNFGGGFFLGTNQSGRVRFGP